MDISDIWFNDELCELYEGVPPTHFILEKWVGEMKRFRQRWILPILCLEVTFGHSLTEFLTVSTDLTDVTLVSDDSLRRLE